VLTPNLTNIKKKMVINCDTCQEGHFRVRAYNQNLSASHETVMIMCDTCPRVLFMTVWYGAYEPYDEFGFGPRFGFDYIGDRVNDENYTYELDDIVDVSHLNIVPPEFELCEHRNLKQYENLLSTLRGDGEDYDVDDKSEQNDDLEKP
jgi:hypothetical protein